MIRDDVIAALREGRSPLVLTERTEHVAVLSDLIRPHVPHLIILQGGMGRKVAARGVGGARRGSGKRITGCHRHRQVRRRGF
jgi:hypothetical protein